MRRSDVFHPLRGGHGWILKKLYAWADGLLLYSQERLNLIRPFLPAQKPAWVAPNSLELTPYIELREQLKTLSRAAIREALGFDPTATHHIIFIGRLLPEKRPELLLDALLHISPQFRIQVHYIGDGPCKSRLEAKLKEHPQLQVCFYGPEYDENKTGKFLYAADLFVMPGYLGLSILHAFSMGTPIVTCPARPDVGPFHAPEITYFEDGVNGLWSPPTAEGFAKTLEGILSAPECLARMREAAEKTAARAGLAPMVEAFAQIRDYFIPKSANPTL